MSEAIFAEGLTKSYNGKTVVDHLNLSVKRGTVFGLLGANGAGKSTTIECMLGTKQADAGTVRLLGQDPSRRRRTLFQRVGVQFQEGDFPLTQGLTMMKHTFLGISAGSFLLPICVMVGAAALCTALAIRFFRWE